MITARDHAGNVSDTKMIGTDGSGIHGVIVEDNAPEITFLVNGSESPEKEYEKAPTVIVTVRMTRRMLFPRDWLRQLIRSEIVQSV